MKKIITTVLLGTGLSLATAAYAADEASVREEIKGYEKARMEAQAEIEQLKIKLEKATNDVNQHETKVLEIQAKLDAST